MAGTTWKPPIDWNPAQTARDRAEFQRLIDLDTLVKTQDWRDQRYADAPSAVGWLDRMLGYGGPEPDWVTQKQGFWDRIVRGWQGVDDATFAADTAINGGLAATAAGAGRLARGADDLKPWLAVGAGVVLVYFVVKAR